MNEVSDLGMGDVAPKFSGLNIGQKAVPAPHPGSVVVKTSCNHCSEKYRVQISFQDTLVKQGWVPEVFSRNSSCPPPPPHRVKSVLGGSTFLTK